jgi:hypothetical protein
MTASAATPAVTREKTVFHVIVDNFYRTFSLDGKASPSSRNALCARAQKGTISKTLISKGPHWKPILWKFRNTCPATRFCVLGLGRQCNAQP